MTFSRYQLDNMSSKSLPVLKVGYSGLMKDFQMDCSMAILVTQFAGRKAAKKLMRFNNSRITTSEQYKNGIRSCSPESMAETMADLMAEPRY